jgi:hypothetical protein
MYLLVRLQSRTGPLLQPQQQAQINEKLLLRGRKLRGEKLPGEFKWIIQLRGSSWTSMNALHGRWFKTILTLPMLLLLLRRAKRN